MTFTKGGILNSNQLESISNVKWKKGGILSAEQLNKLSTGGSEITDQFLGGFGTPIDEGNTLRVQLNIPLNDVNADIVAFAIDTANISSTPKIIGLFSKSAYIAESTHGVYAGSAVTFTVVDSRTVDIRKGSNTVPFTDAMQVMLIATTF